MPSHIISGGFNVSRHAETTGLSLAVPRLMTATVTAAASGASGR